MNTTENGAPAKDKPQGTAGSRLRALNSDVNWESSSSNIAKNDDLTGREIITNFVKQLPNSPGVYRMFNKDGTVLYVGKAKNLKKRVTSYTRTGIHNNRITRMISETAAMEFVTTHTEMEALLLEANLIKRMHPRYNVLLKDDKSFPYILIPKDHEAAGIYKHRGARKKDGYYFGPFATATSVNETVNILQRVFLLRNCTDNYYENRTRPCLQYQIKRCAAPCTGEISLQDYQGLIDEARAFLTGKSSEVKKQMSEKMLEASDNLDFELAAILRDRLSALAHIQARQGINPQTVEEADVFAIHMEGGKCCIQVFFFRTWQNWGNHAFFPRIDNEMNEEEILEAFISQFYDNKPAPRLILTSCAIEETELLCEALSSKMGHKVSIQKPQRGEKRELVDHAHSNARSALGRKMAERASQITLLEGLAKTFGLDHTPKRVEIYDNSHISGTNAIGGMVVAGAEGFLKNQYRKFNIKSEEISAGDDYGMMREVMTRRFSRLLKEHGEPPNHKDNDDFTAIVPWPDLVLIDGGAGQLSAVQEALRKIGLEDKLNLVGIAKGEDRDAGRERFFIPGRAPFSLPMRDPVLYFIQRLRDEAHRFAIGSHRARRKKNMIKSPLDEVAGIGAARKKALLHHFGSAKMVGEAAVEDLKRVEGISAKMAQLIYDHFHE